MSDSLERRALELVANQERVAAVLDSGVQKAVGLDRRAGSGVVSRCMADIEAKPIRWLWPGKIARGKVSMLAGNPGLGKSQVTASMAAIVSTGGQWPVDRTRCEPGKVVFLSAEDDAEDTIKPRLMAAGANLSSVYILDAVLDGFDAQGAQVARHFNLKTDLARLGALLNELGNVALIVIDPITAYLGETDSHKNAEVRALLAPLGEMAARHSAAVVCVSHLNKGGNSEALMRVTGSLAFVAASRAAFIVARDQDDNSRRLFLPMKNNIGKDESGLAFKVETRQLLDNIETSCVVWEAEAVTVTADEALVPDGSADDRSERDEAVTWLQEALADGPLSAKDVQWQAKQAGIAWATVRRAKDVLGIKPAKTRFDGGWEWTLPSKMLKPAEGAHAFCVSTLGKVEHLGEPVENDLDRVDPFADKPPHPTPMPEYVRCLTCRSWSQTGRACLEGMTVSDAGMDRFCGRYSER